MCQMCQEPQFAFLLINCWNFNPEWFEFSFYYDVSQNQLPKDSLLNTGTHKPPLTYTPAYIYSFFGMSWRVKCVSGECFLKWWLPEWRPVILTFRHPWYLPYLWRHEWLLPFIYHFQWLLPWLGVSKSMQRKTFWLHFLAHFSIDKEEIWWCFWTIQVEHTVTIF